MYLTSGTSAPAHLRLVPLPLCSVLVLLCRRHLKDSALKNGARSSGLVKRHVLQLPDLWGSFEDSSIVDDGPAQVGCSRDRMELNWG